MDEEIRALAAAGVEGYVLSTDLPADAESGSVRLVSIPARRSFRNRVQATRLLVRPVAGMPVPNWADPQFWYRCGWIEHVAAQIVREKSIDIVHSHFAWPNGQGGMIVRALTGCPLVATLRGNDVLTAPEIGYGARHRPPFDRAVRRLLRSAERTMYFSDVMRARAIELGAVPQRATVLRKGVDTGHFAVALDRLALRRELGFGSRPMVLTVAGLIVRKGVHHVLEALSRLREQHDFTFVVVGTGPERARLEELSATLGLADRTVFTGRLDRQTIPKYFAACDAFVLGSIVEAAGNVVLESMASGRPVVCTDSGGPGEFVTDGATGFVVPVGDTGAIAEKVGALLADSDLCERLGSAGRTRAVREFSYDRMTSEIIGVYTDLLADRCRQRAQAC